MSERDVPFDQVIRKAIQQRCGEVLEEEIAEACNRVSQRLRDETDRIALRCLDYFDFYRDEKRLVITVKKDIPRHD